MNRGLLLGFKEVWGWEMDGWRKEESMEKDEEEGWSLGEPSWKYMDASVVNGACGIGRAG